MYQIFAQSVASDFHLIFCIIFYLPADESFLFRCFVTLDPKDIKIKISRSKIYFCNYKTQNAKCNFDDSKIEVISIPLTADPGACPLECANMRGS